MGMKRVGNHALIAGLRMVPKNAVSRAAGRLAGLELPGPIRRAQIRAFATAFGVDVSEARDPIESYRSVQDFFVRSLKEGARPVDAADDALVSPCDGAWGASGAIERGTIFQVKGRPYSVGSLLADDEAARDYEGGTFATLYLSPRDYHRFHAPCAGTVVRADYVPGTLWPVNHAGIECVHGVFAQNERICAYLALPDQSAAPLCMVAVGATMVGKVHVTFDTLATNVRGASRAVKRYGPSGPRLQKGEEWGRFEFGSTLVVSIPPGVASLDVAEQGTPLRLGRRIGRLVSPGSDA